MVDIVYGIFNNSNHFVSDSTTMCIMEMQITMEFTKVGGRFISTFSKIIQNFCLELALLVPRSYRNMPPDSRAHQYNLLITTLMM